MYEIRVTADFAAAHFFYVFNGKCENLHGHNYKVYAHVSGAELNEGGMLLDFTRLKGALREICKELDHTNLNDKALFLQNPSAERIAKYIADELLKRVDELKSTKIKLCAVDVFETETSRARYIPD